MQTTISSAWKQIRKFFLHFFVLLAATSSAFAANLSGFVQTADGTPVCALALASGRSMFTCGPPGEFAFTDLPLEQDGTITLQVYADGFYPNVQSLSDFSPQTVVMKPAEICEGGGGSLTNKQKTEKMIGSWYFAYTIISTFDESYYFPGPAIPSSIVSGQYDVWGTDTYGNDDVLAGYSVTLGQYSMLDPGTFLFDQYYVFDFTSANTISGCYYQVDHSDGELGNCYPLDGAKVLELSAAGSVPMRQFATSEFESQTRKANEAEAHSLAKASLAASSADSSKDAKQREDAKKVYEQLREAIQAR